jgi:hypothetical protein
MTERVILINSFEVPESHAHGTRCFTYATSFVPDAAGSMRSLSGAGRRSPQGGVVGLRTGVDLGGEYSTEVPQQVRIWRDGDTRCGTVTCGDGRGWTCCLLFASRGQGFESP